MVQNTLHVYPDTIAAPSVTEEDNANLSSTWNLCVSSFLLVVYMHLKQNHKLSNRLFLLKERVSGFPIPSVFECLKRDSVFYKKNQV